MHDLAEVMIGGFCFGFFVGLLVRALARSGRVVISSARRVIAME